MTEKFFFRDVIKDTDATSLKLSHWSLPKVGTEEDKIQTIEEMEENLKRLEQEARDRGYSKGFDQGIQEGKDQAYAALSEDINQRLNRIDELLSCFDDPVKLFSDFLEEQVMALIKILFKNFLEEEIEVDENRVTKIVNDGLSELPISSDKKYIFMNQSDRDFLEQVLDDHIDEWKSKFGSIVLDAHEDLSRGEILIKTHETTLDGTVSTRIENLLNSEDE